MKVIRKQCEHGERSDEEEAVSNGSTKELSEVLDDCNVQEERLDEANDTHWEVYDTHWEVYDFASRTHLLRCYFYIIVIALENGTIKQNTTSLYYAKREQKQVIFHGKPKPKRAKSQK